MSPEQPAGSGFSSNVRASDEGPLSTWDEGPYKDPDRSSADPGPAHPASTEGHRPQRASHACQRCRRMKLRCVGGLPCERCKRAKQPCDGETALDMLDGESQPSLKRIAELEDLVRDLLQRSQGGSRPGDETLPVQSSLSSGSDSCTAPASLSMLGSATSESKRRPSSTIDSSALSVALPNVRFDLPSTSHSALYPTQSNAAHIPPAAAVPASFPPHGVPQQSTHGFGQEGMSMQMGGAMPPHGLQMNASISPQFSSQHLGAARPITEPLATPPAAPLTRDSPASRLAVAQDSSIMQPPFRPLLIRSRVWDNKQPSRPGSPSTVEDAWYFEGRAGPQSDPVADSIITIEMARQLFDFFFAHSHHFLPIIQFTRHDVDRHTEIRQRSPFLYTVILAIGSRHFQRSNARFVMNGANLYLDDQTAASIRQLAYSHLAAVVMRKVHAFPDVQATLILSVWGLQGQGKGPDPWLLTSVVERIAHRLELQRGSKSPVVSKALSGGVGCLTIDETAGLDRILTQWKTCLTYYYLGFGRPQSNFADFSEEETFIQLIQQRQGSPELAAGVYIASQVQLSKIARDLIYRATSLSEQANRDTSLASDSVAQMLRDLNKRLDDWQRRWTWTGARFALQMNRSSLRFAKLQAEHVRLSVNSIALKADAREAAGSEDSDWLQTCVVKAMDAAISLIDMHISSSETDLLYSYSFEYIFNALAQAGLYLIRLHLARQAVPVEPSILDHYVRSAIQVIEQTDLSFTRHSTTIAGICRDICRVAGIDLDGDDTQAQAASILDANGQNGSTADFDYEAFLHLDGMGLDLGFMFNEADWAANGYTGGFTVPGQL